MKALSTLLAVLWLACMPVMAATQTPPPGAAQTEGYVSMPDGVKLYYQKVGKGKQTVIIPAALFLANDFRQLADGQTLIFYDMRNRGRSDTVKDLATVTIQQDVRDLESIRSHFGVKRFSTIGYSYLGMMVMLYAKDHPERIERIVQLGPVPLKFGAEYPAKFTNNDDEKVVDGTKYREMKKLESEGYDKSHPREYCEMQWQVLRVRLVGDPAHVARLRNSNCDLPNEWQVNLDRHFGAHFTSVQKMEVPWSEVQKVTAPVLTIHGAKDRNAPYGAGREWATKLQNARLLTIQGGAHNSWADAPEVIFPAIRQFLNEKWPVAAEKLNSATP